MNILRSRSIRLNWKLQRYAISKGHEPNRLRSSHRVLSANHWPTAVWAGGPVFWRLNDGTVC